ncbi:MAG: chromosomal replication initiator protein DnaA [Desulfamplus sp.]|nr:chromosomal replication initiator protein DnaA [Desulfamplus sp.]
MESVWNQVKANMKDLLPDHSFRMWIQPIQFMGFDIAADHNPDIQAQEYQAKSIESKGPQGLDSTKSVVIKLACPNSFSNKRIKDNYLAGMTMEFLKLGQEHGLTDVKIELGIADANKPDSQKADTHKNKKKGLTPISSTNFTSLVANLQTTRERELQKNNQTNQARSDNYKRNSTADQLPLPGLTRAFDTGRMLKKDYTFDQFVVGNNNDFAYSASLSLAQGGNNANGALYLLAGTGLGKSHLSQAVGHHVINQGITNKVFYVTAEDFTNEMVHSIQNHTISSFKEKYRKKCDVLILEDIHFLSGKEATQKELAMTLDYLLDAEKKIIFSGCYLPDDIPKMNDQLKSRLTMGLVTKMEAPDFETRVKILKKKSQINGYKIPNEVADYIAQELCDNVRQLESGLAGVASKSSLMGEKINLDLARQVLSNISKSKKAVTIDSIKRLICTEFGISEDDLISTSRKAKLVHPRQMAIYLSRKYTDQPIKTIGKSFNRYHATAIHSINAVEKAIQQQGSLCEQLNYLYKKIENEKI